MSTSVCWELTCDGLVLIQGKSKTLIRLTLQKREISPRSMGHLDRKGFSYSQRFPRVWKVSLSCHTLYCCVCGLLAPSYLSSFRESSALQKVWSILWIKKRFLWTSTLKIFKGWKAQILLPIVFTAKSLNWPQCWIVIRQQHLCRHYQ